MSSWPLSRSVLLVLLLVVGDAVVAVVVSGLVRVVGLVRVLGHALVLMLVVLELYLHQ